LIRTGLQIDGIVQGVGFRPFIHRLAEKHALNGWIRNSSSGVELELEGEEGNIAAFIADVRDCAPPLAHVDRVTAHRLDGLRGYSSFEIVRSRAGDRMRTLVSPDVGICDDCLRELFDPDDRRYRFPFINCTNCGPRFTIIEDIPYDRAKTTMAGFAMCPDCLAEYRDIRSRRYHAQPDCCGICGPSLFFLDASGTPVPGDPIESARRLIASGGIVAVKGLGGIHLACLPEEGVVRELRRRKKRDEKPFALMCRELSDAEDICLLSAFERALLTSPSKPIVLLKKRSLSLLPHISENACIGVMLPYTPVHCLLMEGRFGRLVMTSANISETPIIYENKEAVESLRGIADGFLLNDRDIRTRCDDSLVREADGHPYFLRRSRGYTPAPVRAPMELDGVLACGAEQKASFGLGKGSDFFLSGHIGDLKNIESYDNYTSQISHFEKLFDVSPDLLACDLHPDYLSTVYAQRRAEAESLELVRIQHHHAHLASCMADNGLDRDCIGVIWDGAGLGTDGTIWGGEVLYGGYGGFSRLCSLRTVPLPGGDAAVRDIGRIGYALLRDAQVSDPEAIVGGEFAFLASMLDSGACIFPTSSMGRLFDGAAAIMGIRRRVSYEGQGAVLLESAAADAGNPYPVEFYENGGVRLFDHRELIRALARDVRAGRSVRAVAADFMQTLCAAALAAVSYAAGVTGCRDVCLSGGVFQNMFLLRGLTRALRAEGFGVFIHSRVSCTDEGVSFGQAAVAKRRSN